MTVKEIFDAFRNDYVIDETEVVLQGWVRTNRDNGSIGFIEFNDGSSFNNLQIVYSKESVDDFDKITKIGTGTTIEVEGLLIETPDGKQPFELQLDNLTILGEVDSSYPLQKKRHSFEFLREIAHLRPRANTFNALYRVRSELAFAIHKFFHEKDFLYIHTPIFTGNDAEGAGQTFSVVTDDKNPNDFFGKKVILTVTGQLHVEAFAMSHRSVYTFGPTFRAERSNTKTHAAEFWMVEPEVAFADLKDIMELIEECIKYCIEYVLDHAADEMQFFNNFIDKSLHERLTKIINSTFARITYTEAIGILENAVKNGVDFANKNIVWGMDLQTEHERYITDVHIKGPVFVTDYPKEIKAFYMRINEDGKTVAACDLLVPTVGELVGGSQREERVEVLLEKMKEAGNAEELDWYLDLRRYGGCVHSGFGIGFDRLLMYVTGMQNIRDVQPFARTSGSILF
ncbi:MAG: asparagine--tRNA ligase [Erysipelotrichaceae bacterium]|jgi:asparaginyl-tRNA synthetase|nr:asparagine--tRNA ligase [Erysipelotrichaceae bacterium]